MGRTSIQNWIVQDIHRSSQSHRSVWHSLKRSVLVNLHSLTLPLVLNQDFPVMLLCRIVDQRILTLRIN